MPTFAYSGRTRAGQTVSGERAADTMDAAVAALRREQILVTRITPAKAKEEAAKKEKAGKIEFKIFNDRFEFLPTLGTKRWLDGLVIRYGSVVNFEIVQRQVGTVEGILGGLTADPDGVWPTVAGGYSREAARKVGEFQIDREAYGRKGLGYEKLDQLTTEVLLGVR